MSHDSVFQIACGLQNVLLHFAVFVLWVGYNRPTLGVGYKDQCSRIMTACSLKVAHYDSDYSTKLKKKKIGPFFRCNAPIFDKIVATAINVVMKIRRCIDIGLTSSCHFDVDPKSDFHQKIRNQ